MGTLVCLFGAIACGQGADARQAAPPGDLTAEAQAPVRPGIEVLLSDSIHLVRGSRVGVITNHTGISIPAGSPGRVPVHTIDRLHQHPDVNLVAIFGPEHGYRGEAEAGEHVESGTDARTGLPVHSLYGQTRKPTPAMLEGVDVLVFDIQDIGARYYTYVSTMALAMEAAGEAGIPILILDRPNPIGGTIQGNVLDPAFSTFVGMFPVAMRHGMTPGELARMFVGEFGIEADVTVVPVDGWSRGMAFEDTGLPWVAPSPNMPTLTSALHYPGTCLFEGTNLSVGRGTDAPFQQIGAPWLDGPSLARALNGLGLPDARFDAVTFTPEAPGDGKFPSATVQGVRFAATGPEYDPTVAAVAALEAARRASSDSWQWLGSHFDRLAGTDALRLALEGDASYAQAVEDWDDQIESFRTQRAPYLLYD